MLVTQVIRWRSERVRCERVRVRWEWSVWVQSRGIRTVREVIRLQFSCSWFGVETRQCLNVLHDDVMIWWLCGRVMTDDDACWQRAVCVAGCDEGQDVTRVTSVVCVCGRTDWFAWQDRLIRVAGHTDSCGRTDWFVWQERLTRGRTDWLVAGQTDLRGTTDWFAWHGRADWFAWQDRLTHGRTDWFVAGQTDSWQQTDLRGRTSFIFTFMHHASFVVHPSNIHHSSSIHHPSFIIHPSFIHHPSFIIHASFIRHPSSIIHHSCRDDMPLSLLPPLLCLWLCSSRFGLESASAAPKSPNASSTQGHRSHRSHRSFVSCASCRVLRALRAVCFVLFVCFELVLWLPKQKIWARSCQIFQNGFQMLGTDRDSFELEFWKMGFKF